MPRKPRAGRWRIGRDIETVDDLVDFLDAVDVTIRRRVNDPSRRATVARDGNPLSVGTGHRWSAYGGKRRGKRRCRHATPSHGRYAGTARRPKGEGGAMNGRTADYTPRAYDAAVAWGSKRRRD